MPDLKEYVQDGLKKGYSEQELRKILKDSGYPNSEIDAAFSSGETPKVQTNSLNYFEKIKTLFFHPKQFFDLVEGEKSYGDIFLFFLIIFLISGIIGFFISLPIFSISIIISGMVKLIFLSSIATVIAILIYLGMVHLGVLIFGGREGVFNTFKPVVYAGVIGLVYFFIETIIFGVWNRISPLSIEQQLTISLTPSFASIPKARLIVGLFILIITMIHYYYAAIIGISKFQKMGKLRAFLSIIVISLTLLLITLLLGLSLYHRGTEGIDLTQYCEETLKGRCNEVDINGEPNRCPQDIIKVAECNKGEGYCCKNLETNQEEETSASEDLRALLPDKCELKGVALNCEYYAVTPTKVSLDIRNDLGKDINIQSIEVYGEEGSDMQGMWNCPLETVDQIVNNGDIIKLEITDCDIKIPIGKKIEGKINLIYNAVRSQIDIPVFGSIRVAIQED